MEQLRGRKGIFGNVIVICFCHAPSQTQALSFGAELGTAGFQCGRMVSAWWAEVGGLGTCLC